ncbi:2986_t:CDS:2, partial [Ambispora gerdemannii]
GNLGKSEAITMGEEQAKNLLKEMISNFITQDKNYPQGLSLKNQAKFIGSVFGNKLDGDRKEEVVKETRTVLNGLVEAKINELATKDYEEANKRSKNPNTIKKLAGLYQLTNAEIDYAKELNSEEVNWRIAKAKAHLAQIGNSQTFRKEIELTEKEAEKIGIEAYWKLQDKLSRELANHLINYKGSSEATAFCLKLADILNGIETPEEKNDTELEKEATNEDTMDGYYNLLKEFRKKYDELVKLKINEEEEINQVDYGEQPGHESGKA